MSAAECAEAATPLPPQGYFLLLPPNDALVTLIWAVTGIEGFDQEQLVTVSSQPTAQLPCMRGNARGVRPALPLCEGMELVVTGVYNKTNASMVVMTLEVLQVRCSPALCVKVWRCCTRGADSRCNATMLQCSWKTRLPWRSTEPRSTVASNWDPEH
eukprot:365493-Chlamydomonas_euryale.AAC.8